MQLLSALIAAIPVEDAPTPTQYVHAKHAKVQNPIPTYLIIFTHPPPSSKSYAAAKALMPVTVTVLLVSTLPYILTTTWRVALAMLWSLHPQIS
jgi:hypothetical protein